MKKNNIELSIIIVEYKSGEYLKRLLHMLPKRKDWEVIVVNNDEINRGFGAGCNEGASRAKGKYLLFLNPDVLIKENAIESMLDVLKKHSEIGIVGPKFINAEGKTEQSSTRHPTLLRSVVGLSFLNTLFKRNPISVEYWMKDWDRETSRTVEVLSGAVLMTRAKDFHAIGGFDQRFFLYWEEFDLCRGMEQYGKTSWYEAKAVVDHPREVSMKASTKNLSGIFAVSRFRYMKKHLGMVQALFLEMWLSFTENWRLTFLFLLSFFLRVADITHVQFIGDLGRDYLQAVVLLTGKVIPLLGIPSSVPRFSQGPFNIWFDAISFFFGGVSFQAPILFSAILTTCGVCLLYLFLEKHTQKYAAFFSTLFLAASPAAVLQSRMPFYLFAVPLFLTIFLWRLTLLHAKRRSTIFWAVLSFWLLFQWELATLPFFFLLLIAWWRKRVPFIKHVFTMMLATGVGLFPQILFDLTHQCAQLCGLGVWAAYRVAAVSGFDGRHGFSTETFRHVLEKSFSLFQNITGSGQIGGGFVLSIAVVAGLIVVQQKRRKDIGVYAVLGVVLLGIALFIHGDPSEAYLPPLLVFIPILIAEFLRAIPKKFALFIGCLLSGLALWNTTDLLRHRFYAQSVLPQYDAARWIVQDAHGAPVRLKSYDPGSQFPTYADGLRFFIQIQNGTFDEHGKEYIVSFRNDVVLPTIGVDQQTFDYVTVVKRIR